MMHKGKQIFFLIALSLISYTSLGAQTDSLPLDQKRKFDYYFYEAMNAKALGNYDQAFDYLNYCLAIDSTNANVLFDLGNFYNSIDQKGLAMDLIQKALEKDEENLYYNLAYASLCFENKQFSDAIEIYEKLIKKDPQDNELYVYLSEAHRLDGNISEAINALNRLEKNVGLNEKITLQKYQLYKLNKQSQKAFDEIQKYIQKYPFELKYQILLGDMYLEDEKYEAALATYNKAREIDPNDPYLIASIAEYYERTGNRAAAENEMKTVLVSPKMDVDTKLAILAQYVGSLHQNRKDTETANALFDSLMAQHPQEPKLNLMYGNLLMLQSKKEDARFQYQIFAEANPTNPFGWEQLISTTFPDSLKATIDICNTAISYNKEEPAFYYYLGAANYMDKEYDKALRAIQDGLQYVPDENPRLKSEFHSMMGDLFYHFGKSDSAFLEYDRALEYNPGNVGVLNNYSYYLSLDKKNLDKAERMSSMTIKAEPSNPTFLDTYGWILFEQGAYTMAKIYLEKAIKVNEEKGETNSYEMLEHYGDVLFKTGEEEKALEYWIKAKKQEDEEIAKGEPGVRKSKTLEKKIKTKTYIAE